MTDLQYPVGKWVRQDKLDSATRERYIAEIASTAAKLRAALRGLSEEQLDTPYRPGGWSIRQVVHHLPDSHMNSYVRFKLALTEDSPRIKTYDEKRWAETPDVMNTPVEVSLRLLESLHSRWDALLRGMTATDFARKLDHPENGPMTLDAMLSLYEWHGRHHVAHVSSLRKRMGW